MKFPKDVEQYLKRRYANQRANWLCADAQFAKWPLTLSLEPPSGQEAQQQLAGVRLWISAWRNAKKPGETQWRERRWTALGTHTIPVKIVLRSPEEVAHWAGEEDRWSQARRRYEQLADRWSSLSQSLGKHFDVLADYKEGDFTRLVSILEWLEANPNSNVYPRQLPIAGIDTKWLQGRRQLVTQLLLSLRSSTSSSMDFFECSGLRDLPKLIRIRVLDPKLRAAAGGLCDVSAPIEEISKLGLFSSTIYIVENLQTALAFKDTSSAVVICGLGYDVQVLGQLPWLEHAQCLYWGDLDTHGFAILNKARSYVPGLRSIFMDEATLLTHRHLWVEEEDQHPAPNLPLLEDAERDVYLGLKNHRWGLRVRLEQERIAWDYAWSRLDRPPVSHLMVPTAVG